MGKIFFFSSPNGILMESTSNLAPNAPADGITPGVDFTPRVLQRIPRGERLWTSVGAVGLWKRDPLEWSPLQGTKLRCPS